jgi:hypothetical protein
MKIPHPLLYSVFWVALALPPTHGITASEFHPDSFKMRVLSSSYTTQTNEQSLIDAPKWDPFSDEDFPISVKEIVSQGRKQIEKELPSFVSLYPVRIEHRSSSVFGAWFSVVTFSYGLEFGPTSGVNLPYVVAVVYADGSVAPIKRSEENKGNRKTDNGGSQ